jgi:fused signal recognition particle receptor
MVLGRGGDRLGLFARLKAGLARTHDGFINKVERLILRRNRVDAELLDELEELYLQGDVGPRTTEELMGGCAARSRSNEVGSPRGLFLKACGPRDPRLRRTSNCRTGGSA